MVDLLKIQTEMVRLAESLDYHHGFVCHPVAFKVPFVKGWQELHESYKGELWGKAQGVGIKTGCGHVTVVDIDKPDVPFFDKFVKHFDIKPTTWVITPGGGYHLYFNYCADLPNGNFEPIKWDIRNDGGYIMAPGSYYTNHKKPELNYKKYKFKTLNGKTLDWEYLREIDEEFLKCKHYGIDPETMEFGKSRVTYQTKKQKVKEVSDNNKNLFTDLMMAYAKSFPRLGYRSWLQGVWAITQVSKQYYWDPEAMAIAWSEKLEGYSGPESVRRKVREHSSDKGSFNLSWILNQVDDEAKEAFSKFKRRYHYYDYTRIFKAPVVALKDVEDYVQDSFVRIDRNTNVMWYVKKENNTWAAGKPFKDYICPFRYEMPNPKYTPHDKDSKEPETIIKATNMALMLKEHTLDWVPNYSDLQFLPYHGEDPTPSGTFNTFSGYRHKILPAAEYDPNDEDFKFVMNHWIQYMCNGNRDYYEYVMNWLSWVLKYGWKKPRTAIVMFGIQGIGKYLMWCVLIWKGVIGEALVNCEHDLAKFTGRFNMNRLGKVLHIFDECTALNGNNRVNWDTMKAVVTDRDFMAEPKGKEAFHAVDTAGCVLLSNHARCVDIENSDRRYVVGETSRTKPDAEYFERLAELVHSVRIQRMFFTWLIRRDISQFRMQDIPQTESRNHIQELRGENRPLVFLIQLVQGDLDFDNVKWFDTEFNEAMKYDERWYKQQTVYEEFRKFLERGGVSPKYWPTRDTLVFELKKHGLKVKARYDRSMKWCQKHWSGKQVTCWYIDKATVKAIVRSKRKKPDWDFDTSDEE